MVSSTLTVVLVSLLTAVALAAEEETEDKTCLHDMLAPAGFSVAEASRLERSAAREAVGIIDLLRLMRPDILASKDVMTLEQARRLRECVVAHRCSKISVCNVRGTCDLFRGKDGYRQYRCRCIMHFQGDRCQERPGYCGFKRCLNGGVCDPKTKAVCLCPSRFRGAFCEMRASARAQAPLIRVVGKARSPRSSDLKNKAKLGTADGKKEGEGKDDDPDETTTPESTVNRKAGSPLAAHFQLSSGLSSKGKEMHLTRLGSMLNFLESRFLARQNCFSDGQNTALKMRRSAVFLDEIAGSVYAAVCDMRTDGGGWTVIQRRVGGRQDFFVAWPYYRRGFGAVTADFWLGLETLHRLTSRRPYELRVDMVDADGRRHHAKYTHFRVDSEERCYRLHVGAFSGTPNADHMRASDHMCFSTKDRDNDQHRRGSCAWNLRGGWWYGACAKANYNGIYGLQSFRGVFAQRLHDDQLLSQLAFVEMKIRPSTCVISCNFIEQSGTEESNSL